MKYKILNGTVDGGPFVVAIFDDPEVVSPMTVGLERFFNKWESSKIKEKLKEEADHGYLSLSTNSSGCRRK